MGGMGKEINLNKEEPPATPNFGGQTSLIHSGRQADIKRRFHSLPDQAGIARITVFNPIGQIVKFKERK